MYHSSANGHLGCFHVLAIVNSACYEHWGTHVSFNSGFLGTYAQQWDFWVVWQFYFQFFKGISTLFSVVAVLKEGIFKLSSQLVMNPPAMQETLVRFLGQEDPLENG